MLQDIHKQSFDEEERYRPIAKIGRGGMADVLLALAQGASGFNKLVVLKVLREHLMQDTEAAEMFVDEARLAGRLNHPNVVQTLEVAEYQGRPAMVLEYLEGHSLIDILKACARKEILLPVPVALRIVSEALEGLRYAHDLTDFDRSPLSLVHRDVSPQNLFVTYDGQIKVLDFGIAKAAISMAETRAGIFKGKLSYMAPEQVLGERLDRRADIYAMGGVLWYVATGKKLWHGVSEGKMLMLATRGEIPLPSSVNPDVPKKLERVCMKALSPSLDERYQDAAQMLADVDALASALPERVNARQVGEFVSELFEEDRDQRRQVIRAKLAEVKLETQEPEATGTHRGTVASIAPDKQVGAMTPSPSRKKLIVALSAAATLIALILLLTRVASQSESDATASASVDVPSPPASAPTPPPPAPAVDSVAVASSASAPTHWLDIETTPKNATIFYDDMEVRQRPPRIRVDPDGSKHRVRVEAVRYRSETVEVVAGETERLVVALEPLRKIPARMAARAPADEPEPPPSDEPPAADSPQPSPPPPAPAKTASEPKGARDRIKDLDTSSPW